MKFLFLSIFFFSLISYSQIREVPDAVAFKKWQDVVGYADNSIDLSQLQQTALTCAGDTQLYPLNPQQDLKHYHIFQVGSYDHFKLNADSEACLLGSKYKNSRGVKNCLSPDRIYYVLMSDVFRDRCGRMYRAFWELLYLKKNDSMGTLFSKGRTMYPKNGSSFDFYVGPTYPVDLKELFMLTELFPQDALKISKAQKRAEITHTFNSNTLLYTPLKP